MLNVLMIEDDESIGKMLDESFDASGFKRYQVLTAKEGLELYNSMHFDIVIIDIMLPDMSGLDLHENFTNTPFIFLSARSDTEAKLRGLTCGADDYVVKPFNVDELLARMNIICSRYALRKRYLSFKDVLIDYQCKEVKKSGNLVKLTRKEYALLEVLTKNDGIILSRDKLINFVWGCEYECNDRSIDVHIQKLRKKLDIEEYIVTIYGEGYRFRDNA